MGFTEMINEQIYILFSIYYYEIFLYQGKIQVGRIIQSVSFNPTFIVDFKRKLAWTINKERYFVAGHRIIGHYNIDNALPLAEIEEEDIKEISENIIKRKKITKLVGEATKEQKEKSNPKLITELNMPPHLIFEFYNAHFVTKTIAEKSGTNWTTVILAVCVVIFLVAFMAIMVFGLK